MTKWLLNPITFLGLVTLSSGCAVAEVGLREVSDTRSGLIIRFPVTWYVDRLAPAFTISSFPPGQRRPLSGLARNGGQIVVFRSEQTRRSIANLKDWLVLDREDPNLSAQIVHTLHFKGIEAIRIDWQEQYLRGVSGVTYYLRLADRFVKIQLSVDGEQRKAEFVRVLEQVLDNLATFPEPR